MPIIKVIGLTHAPLPVKTDIRTTLQDSFFYYYARHGVTLNTSDTKVTFIHDPTESPRTPAIAEITSVPLLELSQAARDELCDIVISIIERAGRPLNEAYVTMVEGIRYRKNSHIR
jgi:hypothetical protein